MQVHFNLIIKFFLLTTLIIFSSYFFYLGYYELKKSDLKIGSNVKLYSDKKDLNKRNISINNMNEPTIHKFEESTLNQKIDTKEITIVVKQNDTFSKLIDPFVPNIQNKQKLIKIINKEYDLRTLKINQKIFYI